MPAPTTCREFLDLLRRSDLIAAERLDSYLRSRRDRLKSMTQPEQFADILLADGLLSHFQVKQLLAGKHRGYWIKKYQVLEALGAGGMGQVVLCEQTPMGRLVAVKVLPSATQPGALERFHREARAVAALDHPNIVRAIDVDNEERFHFLVMEYVDGINLQDLVDERGRLEIGRACHYVAQAAQGLHHAHLAGWVHRDIKPGNLLVDRSGVVKILDMGLARLTTDSKDQLTRQFDESAILGTADYLAPEQSLPGQVVDARADIYSLGATFYFLLTGKTPFSEGSALQKIMAHQLSTPRPITDLRQQLPREIVTLIEKMMAKTPARRPQSAQAVAEALRPFLKAEAYPLDADELDEPCPRVRQLLQTVQPRSAPLTPLPREAPRTEPVLERGVRREVFIGAAVGGALLLVGGMWLLFASMFGVRPAVKKTDELVVVPKIENKQEVVHGILSPQEAIKQLGKVCTVQMLVKSTGQAKTRLILFLNSEKDYTSKENFTIVTRVSEAEVEELKAKFQDSTVRVEGLVKLYGNERPQIEVSDPRQIQLVSTSSK
jgi:serine/threonine protein kinase